MAEDTRTLRERLSAIETKLDAIQENLKATADHSVRIDRLEGANQRATWWLGLIMTPLLGLVVEVIWRKFHGA